MSYVERNLLSGEQVLYRAKLSWWGMKGLLLGSLLVIFYGLGLLILGWLWLSRRASEFAVTNKRIVLKLGLINVRTLELQIGKVEMVSVSEPMLGRIMGYGSVIIGGSGGTKEVFAGIENPQAFKRAALQAIEQSSRSAA